MAEILRDALLDEGFDVLMIRDEEDVQLDNVARTVMANNIADCHIAFTGTVTVYLMIKDVFISSS